MINWTIKFRMTIEYEGEQFDPERHQRYLRSSLNSEIIQHFLWPALRNASDKQYMCKAVVIT